MQSERYTPDGVRRQAAAAGLPVREERLQEVAAIMSANIVLLRGAFQPAPLEGVPSDFRRVLASDD